MRSVLVAVVLTLALPAQAAMYKWVDSQGRVQYSDIPPPPNVKNVEERKLVPSRIQTSGFPYAVQEAAKRNPVTLWTHDCGELCDKAREFLARRGVPYAVRNPSRVDELDAWKKASSGDSSVPRLIIGSTSLKGFDEIAWASALDAAGYPRTAPPIKPVAIPPAEIKITETPAPQAAPPAPVPAVVPDDRK
ncbi:MAG: glutaredoxin family protein [Betaproteobacteria bacterium]|nr:MAG: glutaredoxin family protein [Betaproteobacteria bacterium]